MVIIIIIVKVTVTMQKRQRRSTKIMAPTRKTITAQYGGGGGGFGGGERAQVAASVRVRRAVGVEISSTRAEYAAPAREVIPQQIFLRFSPSSRPLHIDVRCARRPDLDGSKYRL